MKYLYRAASLLAVMALVACGSGADRDSWRGANLKEITAYSLSNVACNINQTNKTISVIMPYGTNITSLIASFTAPNATVKIGAIQQVSGSSTNNFTSPLIYIVTAVDGSTANYTVTVSVAATPTGVWDTSTWDNATWGA